jgi:hypothetical protein
MADTTPNVFVLMLSRRQFLGSMAGLAAFVALRRVSASDGLEASMTYRVPMIAELQAQIIQSGDGPIPPYPRTESIIFPRNWNHPVYDPVVSFEIDHEAVPEGRETTYKWAIVIQPSGERFRLRDLAPVPPGVGLATEVFYEFDSVWLGFLSRIEIDSGLKGRRVDESYIECVIRVAEPGLFGDEEFTTVRKRLELLHSPPRIRDLSIGQKIARACEYSLDYWPETITNEAVEFFTNPNAVYILVATTLLFVALAISPDPWTKIAGIGLAAVLAAVYGVDTLRSAGTALVNLYDNCMRAETAADLEYAGKQFAIDGGEPAFNLLLGLFFRAIGKAANPRLQPLLQRIQTKRSETLALVAQQRAAFTAMPIPVTPTAFLELIESGLILVRRMRYSELLAVNRKTKRVSAAFPEEIFVDGKKVIPEQVKFYAVDVVHRFSKEALKNPENYIAVHKIPLSAELKTLLKMAIPNQWGSGISIPEALKHLPRWKLENGRFTIGIPRGFWDTFSHMFNGTVEIYLIPLNVEPVPEIQDEETWILEQ